MHSIQAIVFDLGNVIIDIYPERTLQYYQQQGISEVSAIYQKMAEAGWFTRIETGEVSLMDLMEAFRLEANASISEEALIAGWDSLLGSLPAYRIRLLEKLADSYSLYLLSNTNQRHIEVIDGLVARQYGRKSISNWFIKAYYSFETGYRKPHPRAYQMILEEQGLVAEQTLMVDDLKENIEAAGRLGMKTLWLNPGELTMEKLTSAGI